MNYIKSAGFFSIFYVILYFGLSIGLRFFITDSDLFTGLFYVILLAAALIYLKICGDDIKDRPYEFIRSILDRFFLSSF